MAISELLSRTSLKVRVTLVVLGGILMAFWSLAVYTGNTQREEMKHFLGRQQQAMVNLVATRLEGEIQGRIEALERVARETNADSGFGDPKAFRDVIERHFSQEGVFSGGVFFAANEAADLPEVRLSTAARIDLPDRHLLKETMRAGLPLVGRVTTDAEAGSAVFSIAVPVKNRQGRVTGALAGRVYNGTTGMIQEVMASVAMTEATYLVVSPETRVVIASNNLARVGEALPRPGVSLLVESFIEGFEGSGVLINAQGLEELVASKGVPSAGWYVMSAVLAKDALEPVRAVQRRVLVETSLISLFLALLFWWMLQNQLKPLGDTTQMLAEMSDSGETLCLLPPRRQDEIGSLIGSFNRLMEVIGKRENDLRESESRYRMLFEEMSDAFALHAVVSGEDGRPKDFVLLSVNPVFDRLTGLAGNEVIGRRFGEVLPGYSEWMGPMIRVAERGGHESFEFRSPDSGATVEVRVFRPAPGQVACLFSDISPRKRAEEALRRNLESFRGFFAKNSLVMLMVDPRTGRIMRANPAAAAFYGYPHEQLIGMSLDAINDVSSDRGELESMCALDGGREMFLLVHRLASGELRDVEVHLSMIDYEGQDMLFALVHDVTERKQAEGRLILLAQTDTLTGLPNRRHFLEMAGNELERRHRYRGALSVLMIDIDHFKKINDSYGHQIGDKVLQAVGRLFPEALRNSDFVGRIGGEEFAAMLPETGGSKACEVAERVRQQVEMTEVVCEDGVSLRITLSIGVSSVEGDDDRSLDALLEQADQALYAAKNAGRNRVGVFGVG